MMTILNYTVNFKKTVLSSFIGLSICQSCFALEALSDDHLSETTGEGIAILPQDAYMVFRGSGNGNENATDLLTDRSNDIGNIHFLPVGPLSQTALNGGVKWTSGGVTKTHSVGKADLYLYGLALSKADSDPNSRLASTAAAAKITSWGTAENPWLLKVGTQNNVPNFDPAAGYLPGARYGTCPANNGCYAPSNNFATNFDVLAGIKARLMGGINFALIPRAVLTSDAGLVDGVNALNVVGQMDLDSTLPMNNSLQLLDPDGSTIGLDNLSGSIAFDNSLIVNKNSAGFNYSFLFNPQRSAAGVFRARDFNLYPSTGTLDATGNPVIGSAQRLGELAITGGRLSSQMAITPRNGDFTF